MKWLLRAGLFVAVAVSAIASWRMLHNGGENAPAAQTPSQNGTPPDIQGIGYVEPASEVRRLMLRAGGVVATCSVRPGDTVRKGEVLLELDNSIQKADVELARRLLEQARADTAHVKAGVNPFRIKVLEHTIERLREKLRHLAAEVDRYDQLVGQGGVSKQDYERTKTQQKQAAMELREQEAEVLHLRNYVTPENIAVMEAKVHHAEASLRVAEERLQETKLHAPFDGTVLKLLKREGEGVGSYVPEAVVLFGDISRLRVRVEIDERFVKQLRVGQTAEVYGRNLQGKSYPGKLVELERIMGDKTVFTGASTERKNLQILQVVIEMAPTFTAPVGLQVDVRIESGGQ